MNLTNSAIVDSRINYSEGVWYAEVITMAGESYIYRTPFVEPRRAQLMTELVVLRAESIDELEKDAWMRISWDAYFGTARPSFI